MGEVVPKELWGHELFRGSATFRDPASPLLAEWMDRHLRELRRQPSTADSTPDHILQGLHRLYRQGRAWLEHDRNGVSAIWSNLQPRLDRLQQMTTASISAELLERSLRSLQAQLPEPFHVHLPLKALTRQDISDRLVLLSLLILEFSLRQNPDLYCRYAKRMHAVMTTALTFNITTDLRRLIPVLHWIRELLTRQRRAGCSYADVGCAMDSGAPGILAARDLLRPEGHCSVIHGIDIVAPSRELARDLARQHILLYAADPLDHPLPRRFDVILLANVHRHLTLSLQNRLLTNLSRSLSEYGLLFINWRFSDAQSPCVCLEKRRGRLWIAAERNCIE